MAKNFKQIRDGINLGFLTSDPSDPKAGDLYFNITSNIFKFYDGVGWEVIPAQSSIDTDFLRVDGTNAMAGNLDMATNDIIGAGDVEAQSIFGSAVSIDLGTATVTASGTSVELTTRKLIDTLGNTTVNWENKTLSTNDATPSLTWGNTIDVHNHTIQNVSDLTGSNISLVASDQVILSSTNTLLIESTSDVLITATTDINLQGDNVLIQPGVTGVTSVGSRPIEDLADGVNATDAVNKGQLDAVTAYTDATFIPLSEKAQPLGVATLDGGGKIPVAQLPSAIMTYEGVWNASTNSPTLADGVGDTGMVYRVGVAGTQDLGSGPITFDVGDYVIYNGTVWEKSDTTDAVASVNGFTGIVTLDTDDIAEGTTNLYFSDERAQDAVGTILLDSTTIDLTYDDVTPSISAEVIDGSITDAKIAAGIDAIKIADGSVSNIEFQYLDGVTSNIQTQLNGKITGPASATDNAIVRFDATTGKLVQNSGVLIDDSNKVILPDTGANSIGIKAAATVTASYDIVLPDTAPASDTYLKYDGVDYIWDTIVSAAPFEGSDTTLTASDTIALDTARQQFWLVAGNSGPVTLSNTPFSGTVPTALEITLIGNSDANAVTIPANDSSGGVLGYSVTLGRGQSVTYYYSSTLDRYIIKSVSN